MDEGQFSTEKLISHVIRKLRIHLKGDERILVKSDFVESVLGGQNEQFERHYGLQSLGIGFNKVVDRVMKFFELRTNIYHFKDDFKLLFACQGVLKLFGLRGPKISQT